MVRAVAAISNGGTLVTPHVVGAVGGAAQPGRRVPLGASAHSLRRLRDGMREVVLTGTADDVDWDRVPAAVYGKTGTAQVGAPYDPQRLEDGPWHHWFVGWAEAPGRRTVAFACLLHARTEAAAGGTAAHAVADLLAWWYARGGE
jgi:cell division protein FtsI/penicillin-binding protein 2